MGQIGKNQLVQHLHPAHHGVFLRCQSPSLRDAEQPSVSSTDGRVPPRRPHNHNPTRGLKASHLAFVRQEMRGLHGSGSSLNCLATSRPSAPAPPSRPCGRGSMSRHRGGGSTSPHASPPPAIARSAFRCVSLGVSVRAPLRHWKRNALLLHPVSPRPGDGPVLASQAGGH